MTLEMRRVRLKPSPVVDAVEATRENLGELTSKISGGAARFNIEDDKVYRMLDGDLAFQVGDFLIFDEADVWLDTLNPEEMAYHYDFVDNS